LRQFDVAPRDRPAVLAEDVKKDEEVARAAIEDSVKGAAAVTPHLAQRSVDL
jgi:hypothetical protein